MANNNIKVNTLSTRVVVVYRPPSSCKNELRYDDFAIEWASYIEQFFEVQEELFIVGDFNIHVDSSNNESQSFLGILNANGLIQHVKSSTYQKGHILDLVITREQSILLKRPPVVFISGVFFYLINNYHSILQKLTDKYALLQCKTISLGPHAPWYTNALRQEIRMRSERVAARTMYRRRKLTISRN